MLSKKKVDGYLWSVFECEYCVDNLVQGAVSRALYTKYAPHTGRVAPPRLLFCYKSLFTICFA